MSVNALYESTVTIDMLLWLSKTILHLADIQSPVQKRTSRFICLKVITI